ncbi:MAG TPA: hypothetical protein VHL58_19280 [Thermoanaerobaculia bacterium]|nr:hypothetical protein [Thermoanaerobaculia bacterium]
MSTSQAISPAQGRSRRLIGISTQPAVISAFILGLSLTLGAASSQAANPTSSVTTVVKDSVLASDGVTVVPLLVQSDSPLSGGGQTYSGGQLSPDYLFTVPAGRKIFVDLRNSAGGTGAPFATAYVPGYFYTYCANNSLPTPTSLTGVGGPNSSTQCPMAIRFDSGGVAYFLRMNVFKHATDNVLIACTHVTGDQADPNSPCNGWKIVPTGADGRNLALLTKKVTVNKVTTETELGNYYTSFRIELTKP